MELNRVTSGVRFDTGISTADWTRGTVGQTPGQTQGPLLPGSTTVTETLKELFLLCICHGIPVHGSYGVDAGFMCLSSGNIIFGSNSNIPAAGVHCFLP